MDGSEDNGQSPANNGSSVSPAPFPLSYESRRDRLTRKPPASMVMNGFAFISAFVATFFLMVWADYCVYEIGGIDFHHGQGPRPHPATAGVYAFLTIVAFVLLRRLVKKPGWGTPLGMGVRGIMLGAGLGLLVGALYFALV